MDVSCACMKLNFQIDYFGLCSSWGGELEEPGKPENTQVGLGEGCSLMPANTEPMRQAVIAIKGSSRARQYTYHLSIGTLPCLFPHWYSRRPGENRKLVNQAQV